MGMGSLLSPLAVLAALLCFSLADGAAVDFDPTQATPFDAALNGSEATKYWGPWTPARATWYGQPNGAGPDDNGGACGFKHTNQYPFASMTSCGNQPLFKDGKGCGSCYKVNQMHQGSLLLRPDGDGDHHRHELLPCGALPLRPQRHRLRPPRQARPQRQAPPLRHHRHRVHTGAVRVPGAQDRVPRGGVLQPRLLRGAGGVRGRRRRRGAGGPHGVEGSRRRPVDEDEGVVGIHLAPRLQPPPPGAILHPHPQRVRQDARRQQRHPGQLEAQHLLPLLRPVQLNRQVAGAALTGVGDDNASVARSTSNATTHLAACPGVLGCVVCVRSLSCVEFVL